MTWMHNVWQNYAEIFLTGNKRAAFTAAATQAAVFGTKSIPGMNLVEDYFFPANSGQSLYGHLRSQGMDDDMARLVLYGGPSAITGLDFSAKGTINASFVPGAQMPASISIGSSLIEGIYTAAEQLANDTGGDPRVYWEILQTRMPNVGVRGLMNAFTGYKVDRNGDLVISKDDVGDTLWMVSSLLNFRTLDESIKRELVYKKNAYESANQNTRNVIARDARARLRAGESTSEVFKDTARRLLETGADRKYLNKTLRSLMVKATETKFERTAKEVTKSRKLDEGTKNLRSLFRYATDSKATFVDDDNTSPKLFVGY